MAIDISNKVEFELTEELHESGVFDRSGSIVGPQFYVPLHVPKHVKGQLGAEAVETGYKPGEKIRYKVSVERIS